MSYTRADLLGPGFVVGYNEHLHLGPGWYPRTESPDRPGLVYRTSQPEAEFHLRGEPGSYRWLRLLLSASTTLIGGPARLEILCAEGGEAPGPLATISVPWEAWAVYHVRLYGRLAQPRPTACGAQISFMLRTLTPFVPDAVLHNGDYRPMGIHLAAAYLQ